MYSVSPFQAASRPDERRRNPRHRAPSIIYAQLGSDNGGIVVNLGIDGMACHAAQKLIVEKNSTLNLRLRGSGLNADLAGELVWLGATQKEVGICFKNLSTTVRQEIADWIAREAQVCGTAALEGPSRPKPMPAMPGISASVEASVPHSLSAALAISRTISPDPPSSAGANTDESSLAAPLDSASAKPVSARPPEIVSPIQQSIVPADILDGHAQARDGDSSASPAQSQVEQRSRNQLLPDPSPIGHPDRTPAVNSSPIILSEESAPPVREKLAQAPSARPGKREPGKAEAIKLIALDRVFIWLDRWLEGTAAEKWIPPALRAAWGQGNRRRKFLLAGAAATCMGIFALISILAVAYIDSSFSRPVRSGPPPQQSTAQQSPVQQPSAPSAASVVRVAPPQTGPLQPPPVPPVTVPPPSPRPQPSFIANLAKTVLGYEPGQSGGSTEIDEHQVHVQVWTSKSSGYYYCTDDAFYKTVQPGTFMPQGDALQSGYRARLGQFCN